MGLERVDAMFGCKDGFRPCFSPVIRIPDYIILSGSLRPFKFVARVDTYNQSPGICFNNNRFTVTLIHILYRYTI
jgi:hypothetical protein